MYVCFFKRYIVFLIFNFLFCLKFFRKDIDFIKSPLIILGLERNYDLSIITKGGGLTGQSDAIMCFNIIIR